MSGGQFENEWAHFNAICETTSDCILLVQTDTATIVSASAPLERQVGAGRGEWVERRFYTVLALRSLAADRESFDRFAAEIAAKPRDCFLTNRSGDEVPCHLGAITYNAGGKPYLLLRIRPLQIDTRSPDNLMRSAWISRLVVENAPDGINVRLFDTETGKMRLLACNQRFVEMSGYTEEQLMEKDDLLPCARSLLTTAEDHEVMRKLRNLHAASGVASWLRPDGRDNCFEWRSMPVNVSGQIYVLGIDRDVTVQRRALNALKSREAELDALINNIPDLVWFKDARSQYVTVNAAFLHAINKRLEDIRGKTDYDISPPDVAAKFQADDARVIREKTQLTVEEKHEFKGRPPRWIVTTKSPIMNEQGNVLGTVGIARDITERRMAEIEHEQQRARVEAILERVPIEFLERYSSDPDLGPTIQQAIKKRL
ncbi:MAG TPA: PAS domain-containing protein [Planctomycetota bacterium]|jgi:PAS domain S-box-containing protein